jgi:hypothetical protein
MVIGMFVAVVINCAWQDLALYLPRLGSVTSPDLSAGRACGRIIKMTDKQSGGRKMKKKVIAIVLALVLCLAVLAGCGSKKGG